MAPGRTWWSSLASLTVCRQGPPPARSTQTADRESSVRISDWAVAFLYNSFGARQDVVIFSGVIGTLQASAELHAQPAYTHVVVDMSLYLPALGCAWWDYAATLPWRRHGLDPSLTGCRDEQPPLSLASIVQQSQGPLPSGTGPALYGVALGQTICRCSLMNQWLTMPAEHH